MASRESGRTAELVRQIGLITVISAGIGSMIGSGIFKKPGVMATQLGSPELLVLVWVVAGFMTLFGSLSIAEISRHVFRFGRAVRLFQPFVQPVRGFPVRLGGVRHHPDRLLRGDRVRFFRFARILRAFSPSPGSMGELCPPYSSFGEYHPVQIHRLKLCTIALIVFLTAVNYLGVKFGSAVQVLFTGMKGAHHRGHRSVRLHPRTREHREFRPVHHRRGCAVLFRLPGVIIAMSGAFWAYDGWINVTYISGEIHDVQRTLPRGMMITAVTVMIVYILINLAYIYVIPVGEMAAPLSRRPGSGGNPTWWPPMWPAISGATGAEASSPPPS